MQVSQPSSCLKLANLILDVPPFTPRSPWRYFQNLFMGLGTGMDMEVSSRREHPQYLDDPDPPVLTPPS